MAKSTKPSPTGREKNSSCPLVAAAVVSGRLGQSLITQNKPIWSTLGPDLGTSSTYCELRIDNIKN